MRLSDRKLGKITAQLLERAFEACGNYHDAEDMVQDLHLAAEKSSNGSDHRESISTASNLMFGLSTSKKRKKNGTLALPPEQLDSVADQRECPIVSYEIRDLSRKLDSVVTDLPRPERLAYELKEFRGFTYPDLLEFPEFSNEYEARRAYESAKQKIDRLLSEHFSDRSRLRVLPAPLVAAIASIKEWMYEVFTRLSRMPSLHITTLFLAILGFASLLFSALSDSGFDSESQWDGSADSLSEASTFSLSDSGPLKRIGESLVVSGDLETTASAPERQVSPQPASSESRAPLSSIPGTLEIEEAGAARRLSSTTLHQSTGRAGVSNRE